MKRWLCGGLAVAMIVILGAARQPLRAGDAATQPASQPAKVYGYDDTPMLPNSPWRVHDRKRPQSPVVEPGEADAKTLGAAPPAGAIVLFDGKDTSKWQDAKGKPIQWKVEDGCLVAPLKGSDIFTKESFDDCHLHLEWATPEKPEDPMHWGNSGVFFMSRYELQIIESHDVQIYADGIAGAIYGQTPPRVNASRKPGQWQSYDVDFTAPRFRGGKLDKPARITVRWNGVLVQDNTEILGSTGHRKLPQYTAHNDQMPLALQQHGSAVRFRNIWIQPVAGQSQRQLQRE